MFALREKDKLRNMHRKEIYTFEQEAENLEKEEADLLRQLEVTQERERNVFSELKSALMDSSMTMQTRISGTQFMESFNNTGDERS